VAVILIQGEKKVVNFAQPPERRKEIEPEEKGGKGGHCSNADVPAGKERGKGLAFLA